MSERTITTDSLGKRFIRSLVDAKDLEIPLLLGLDRTSLFGDAQKCWDYIQKHLETYKDWPTTNNVEENTGCSLPEEPEKLDYISDLIRKRSLGISLDKDIRLAIEEIEARDPDKALDVINNLAAKHYTTAKKSRITSFRDSGLDRLEEYKKTKAEGGYKGIPTPWPHLDRNIQGWVDGTFNVIAAMSSQGKSYQVCICADFAEKFLTKKATDLKLDGAKPVLIITLEMSTNKIARRIDAVKYKIPFGKLRDSDLSPEREKEWLDQLEEAKKSEDVCTDCSGLGKFSLVEGGTKDCEKCSGTGKLKLVKSDIIIADKSFVKTVADVVTLVRQHDPAIVFIDGGYRLEGRAKEGRGFSNDWSKTVEITNDLQLYAEKTNIPWIVTTQFGDSNETGKEAKRGKGKDKPVKAWNVRYGKEWFINPDVLIGLYAGEEEKLIKQTEIHTLKFRDSDKPFQPFSIHFDLDTMDFSAVSPLIDGDPFDFKGDGGHKIDF